MTYFLFLMVIQFLFFEETPRLYFIIDWNIAKEGVSGIEKWGACFDGHSGVRKVKRAGTLKPPSLFQPLLFSPYKRNKKPMLPSRVCLKSGEKTAANVGGCCVAYIVNRVHKPQLFIRHVCQLVNAFKLDDNHHVKRLLPLYNIRLQSLFENPQRSRKKGFMNAVANALIAAAIAFQIAVASSTNSYVIGNAPLTITQYDGSLHFIVCFITIISAYSFFLN